MAEWEDAPAERDPEVVIWRRIAFWVPTSIALVFTLWANLEVRGQVYRSGYEPLVFLFAIPVGVGATLVWLAIGAIVAEAAGRAHVRKAFVAGAGAAAGVVLLTLTVGCFALGW